jgi:hypothetical protein
MLHEAPRRLCSYAAHKFADLPVHALPGLMREDPDGQFGYEFQSRFYRAICPYCDARLTQREVASHADGHSYLLGLCDACGWWALLFVRQPGSAMDHLSCGLCQTYDVAALDVPLDALRDYLRRNPHDMAHVNPEAFERLVGECLKSEYAPCDVIHIGGSGDGGVDLKLVEGNDRVFLIQVKRRSDLASREGVQVVRELNGVLFKEGRAKGMVVTTASGFTRAALKERDVKTPTLEPYEVRLLAFDDIVRMLHLPSPEPYEPWMRIVTDAQALGGWRVNDSSARCARD